VSRLPHITSDVSLISEVFADIPHGLPFVAQILSDLTYILPNL
jgi:hypothetical protein